MKRFLLIAICYLPIALFAQTSQTGSDYIARRLQVPLLDAPQKVQNASVFVSGNPGPATYYYWIVTNGAIGASSPAGPFQIGNAPNTLSVSNFNQISWNNALGAVSFDVLRTSTPGPPFGACNCAVATAVAGSSTTDQANALNAYTVNTFDPSTVSWAITNESVSAGVSQITFRVGGVAKFSLGSSGGAVTLATPFTAPAHQFFNNFSAGGIFSAAQPSSADISDGTGTGVVARASGANLAGPSISSPTTTGTDNGTENLGGKTLTGTTPYNRIRANQGTPIVVGDVSAITNFGTTASVAGVSGTDSAGTINISSSGTGQIANGQFTLTFHDGTWTTAPVCIVNRSDGNGPNSAPAANSTSATVMTVIFAGAPVAGTTYGFNFVCFGKP